MTAALLEQGGPQPPRLAAAKDVHQGTTNRASGSPHHRQVGRRGSTGPLEGGRMPAAVILASRAGCAGGSLRQRYGGGVGARFGGDALGFGAAACVSLLQATRGHARV
jgi:hypothetical protein